jgi:uncharacterized membrane protein
MEFWVPEVIYGLVSIFLFIGFWAVVITIVARLLRRNDSQLASSSAIQVLEERYARGEIARDEFLERRSVLLGHG